ncbi:MAG: BatA domain-containing protein [Bacteroidota bacterium]
MTFLNPFVLFGLAAATIPILIHLFNIRKLRTIEFSTLSFLKELNKNKIRKIKIRQWILLALRTMLILLIVLAFSRPALKGNFGSAGSRAASTIVILLDNSASMSLNNERGKFLAQAQTQALQIISLLQENDDVFFLRLSDLPNATTETATHDLRTLESLIRETEVQYSHRTIKDGIRLSSHLLQQSKNFNKEVYIISDGQASSLSSLTENNSVTENLFDPQVKIFYSFLSQRQTENAAIERTVIPPALLQANKPFTLNVVVKNYGTVPLNNHLVSVVFDGARVMQKSVSLGSGMSSTLEFNLIPSHSGTVSGYVELEDDPFESDNRYYFSVNIPGQINVSIISTEEGYSHYIFTALNVAAMSNRSSPVSISTFAPSQMNSSSLAKSDVLVITGVKTLPSSQTDILNRFLMNGGNVLFFPSADTSSFSYDYLKPVGLADMSVTKTNTTFEKVDLQFPIFQGMFEQGIKKNAEGIESPHILTTVNVTPETNVRSVISLSNGKNFLWLKEVGKGKLLGFSVPAVMTWSDFPIKGIFVPLLYQSVLYLSSPLNTAGEMHYRVGEKVEFNSSQLKKGKMVSPTSLQLFDTENRKIPLQTYNKTNSEGISETMFTFNDPQSAGMYSAVAQNDTLLALPVNVPREESNGILTDDEQINNIFTRFGIEESSVTKLLPDTDVANTITQSRFGIELWRYLLMAAALIALIEMFVAREPKQQ